MTGGRHARGHTVGSVRASVPDVPGTLANVRAVVLRGPANTAPESSYGPFADLGDAERWAEAHQRDDGYCVAQELIEPGDPN